MSALGPNAPKSGSGAVRPPAGSSPRRRRIGWALAALAAVAAVALPAAWLLWPATEAGDRPADVAFPWLRAPSTIEPMPGAASAAADASAPGPAASHPALAARAARAAREAASGPVAHDLCGLGRVVVPGGGGDREGGVLPELPAPVGRHALEEAQARLLQTLAGGDARLRVAAGLLQQPTTGNPGAEAAWARTLLADALASRDAQALRWAASACPFADDEATCRRRLARARVEVEPANALHWFELAEADPAAADAAWAGAARAQVWREQPLGLAGVLLAALPPDVPGYLLATLATEAMARDAAFPAPPLTLALERCPAIGPPGTTAGTTVGATAGTTPGPARAAVPAECERLARLLLERGDSVQSLMLGRELGAHLGFAAPRLQRLDDEVAALQQQEHHWAVDEQRPLGCATVDRQREHIAAVQRDGELAVLRRNLAAARTAGAAAGAAPGAPAGPPVSPATPTPATPPANRPR